ncbi:LolA-like protein [Aquiflexum balticum]|uniref:peptidase, M16 family protein n=1 Tax=Aquiflexum balticum TaxID=280473 RepID=UPI000A04BD99|nr:peptidase, M16 family protein [Aquiflexum balticum]
MKKLGLFAAILTVGTLQVTAMAGSEDLVNSGLASKIRVELKNGETDPAEVISKYIKAVGGKEKISKILNSVRVMEADFQGNIILMKGISDQQNGRMMQETSVMGNVVQKTIVVNGEGTISTMGQEQAITEEMMQMIKSQMYLFPEGHYEEMGFGLEIRGTEKISGEDVHALVITFPNGMKIMEYYSVRSGLKLKTSSDATGDIDYSDYQEVDGILIPMTLTITNAMLPTALEGKVTSILFNQELTDADFK